MSPITRFAYSFASIFPITKNSPINAGLIGFRAKNRSNPPNPALYVRAIRNSIRQLIYSNL